MKITVLFEIQRVEIFAKQYEFLKRLINTYTGWIGPVIFRVTQSYVKWPIIVINPVKGDISDFEQKAGWGQLDTTLEEFKTLK